MPLRKRRKQRAEPASIARYRYAVYNRAEIAEILETQSLAGSTIPRCKDRDNAARDLRARFPKVSFRNRERNREFARPASVHASRIPRGNLTINRAAVTTANKTRSVLKSASIAGYRYAVYGPAEITASPHLKPENRSAFSDTELRLGSSGGCGRLPYYRASPARRWRREGLAAITELRSYLASEPASWNRPEELVS